MSSSGKSSTPESPKPVNIFYIWYGELCRRLNLQPLSMVKPAKPKNETVLEFVADRIKAEEWGPILNALRQDTSLHVVAIRSRVECKFLDEIDTERKARDMKRKGCSLHTAFVLKSLISSLIYSINRSQVITCLELDGLPITAEYLQPLLEALSKNKTIKLLSLKHCPIRDYGCQQLCMCLRYITNIEILNLTACGLGSLSAQYIAKVIRYQQIHRYCESWHSSLRYEDPDIGLMTGLKRITLNNNPNIGDEGLTHILNELDDDLWIKALDMQKCNITENISTRLIDVIDYSKSLEVADFRNNDQLCPSTMEKILSILKNKQRFGYECEFQWCLTATTIPYASSTNDVQSFSSTAESRNLQKSKSVVLKQISKRSSDASLPIRRIKTFTAFPKNNRQPPTSKCNDKNEVSKLHTQLQQEIAKREQTEQENKELQKRLETIRTATKAVCEAKEKVVKFNMPSENTNDLIRTKEVLNITLPTEASLNTHSAVSEKISAVQRLTRIQNKTDNPNQYPSNLSNNGSSSVEFVFAIDEDKDKNIAQSLFENILYRNGSDDSNEADEDIFNYFNEETNNPKDSPHDITESTSNSNASLLRFVEEIKINSSSLECELKKNSATKYKRDSNQRHLTDFQKLLTKVPPVS